MILEGVLPIVMEANNLIEMVNSMNRDLVEENLVDTIKKDTNKVDLSLDQAQSLTTKHGKKKKRVRRLMQA